MEFKEYSLAELSKNNRGSYGIGASAVEYCKDLYTYLRITDINEDGTLDYSNLKSVDDENAYKYVLEKGDIVFARTGNSTGKSYYYDGEIENLVYAGFLIKFSLDDKKLNPKFMKYYTMTREYKSWVKGVQTGSTRGNINEKMYGNMKIKLPTREYQDKIVALLEKFDKKIEINNKINNDLYETLDKLYSEIYLNNEKFNEWKDITLDETTAKFATGLNPRKNFVLGQGNNYYVTIKNMQNNQVILDDKCDKVNDDAILKINKRSDLEKGDLLFSGIGTIGRVYLIDKKPENWNISESVFTLRPNNLVSSEFLYLLLLNKDMQNYAVSLASGSVQKGIRMADLKKYTFKLPNEEFMKEFTEKIKTLINKVKNNEEENIYLSQLRDTLIPKLMYGEIDLDKVKL